MLTTLMTALPNALAQTTAYPGPAWGLVSLAVLFFIIAIVAYVFGARGVAGMSASIGRTLLFVFLLLAILVVIISLVQRA